MCVASYVFVTFFMKYKSMGFRSEFFNLHLLYIEKQGMQHYYLKKKIQEKFKY